MINKKQLLEDMPKHWYTIVLWSAYLPISYLVDLRKDTSNIVCHKELWRFTGVILIPILVYLTSYIWRRTEIKVLCEGSGLANAFETITLKMDSAGNLEERIITCKHCMQKYVTIMKDCNGRVNGLTLRHLCGNKQFIDLP